LNIYNVGFSGRVLNFFGGSTGEGRQAISNAKVRELLSASDVFSAPRSISGMRQSSRSQKPGSDNIDFPRTGHVAHQPFKPVFCLRIPRRFVRSAKAKWNKVIDLVVEVCSRPQSVSSKNFVPSRGKHRTPVFFAVPTRGIAIPRPYRTARQILVWSNLKCGNGRDCKNGDCGQRALHWRRLCGAIAQAAWRSLFPRPHCPGRHARGNQFTAQFSGEAPHLKAPLTICRYSRVRGTAAGPKTGSTVSRGLRCTPSWGPLPS